MATASSLLSEDQFLCPICLDVFTDPVTIPCGHNFCKNCITEHWGSNVRNQCPVCKKDFCSRPELHINTFISEMAVQFKNSYQCKASGSSEQQGEVLCDVCTETKLKALKSCLVCLTSYCETHLEPHHRITGLKRHKLIDPVENLEDRMCKKHDRPLELFCKTDQTCVCWTCAETDHKSHHTVSLEEECKATKAELATKVKVQQMIRERRLKVEQIKESVKLSKEDADRETAAGVQVFTALVQSVERGLVQLIDTIEEKQKATERQAEGFIKELEEEISELMKRSSEVEQLLDTEDHLRFLQSYSLLTALTKDWTKVKVHSSCDGILWRAVAQLEEKLRKEMKRMCADAELKRVRRYAVDVTLDDDTASPYLTISGGGKTVTCGDVKRILPDQPKRFSTCAVLGKQGFSSGRFYYEVQVGGKTKWDLGVVRESVNRKAENTVCPDNGYWAIWLRNGDDYRALAGPSVCLSLKSQPSELSSSPSLAVTSLRDSTRTSVHVPMMVGKMPPR